jgi:two-component system, chemotaxis family, protein-glutamate methylesterase/glutaminase
LSTPSCAFDAVVLASSAGGLNALTHVLAGLGADFPAALIVVQHVHPDRRSMMADILQRRTALRVTEAADGDMLQAGHVYIAPSDHHLLLYTDGTLRLSQTPLVRYSRPSADVLFESAAAHFKTRLIAVVLSGSGTDGAIGVTAIKQAGGTVIVQQPQSAEFDGMPAAARATGFADLVLALDDIAPALDRLCRTLQ